MSRIATTSVSRGCPGDPVSTKQEIDMQTMNMTIQTQVEIRTGDPAAVAKEIAEMIDGYEPPGGDFDYTITESRCRSASLVAD